MDEKDTTIHSRKLLISSSFNAYVYTATNKDTIYE